jgi:hypothetical protein
VEYGTRQNVHGWVASCTLCSVLKIAASGPPKKITEKNISIATLFFKSKPEYFFPIIRASENLKTISEHTETVFLPQQGDYIQSFIDTLLKVGFVSAISRYQ